MRSVMRSSRACDLGRLQGSCETQAGEMVRVGKSDRMLAVAHASVGFHRGKSPPHGGPHLSDAGRGTGVADLAYRLAGAGAGTVMVDGNCNPNSCANTCALKHLLTIIPSSVHPRLHHRLLTLCPAP